MHKKGKFSLSDTQIAKLKQTVSLDSLSRQNS